MINRKLKKTGDLLSLLKKNKAAGQKIVFTNGCFDIIHAGHVRYLSQAKSWGDKLVLGLNSDRSVKKIKGVNRPVNNQEDRALVLSALEVVDYIVIFDEDTPYNLIKEIKPDVLVKGGDWKEEEIVGSDIVKANNGKVVSLDYYEGKSTTGILNMLNKKESCQ